MALPSECLMTAWENLQEEIEPTEDEDQITQGSQNVVTYALHNMSVIHCTMYN